MHLSHKKKKGRTSETPLLSEIIKQNNTKKKKAARIWHARPTKKESPYLHRGPAIFGKTNAEKEHVESAAPCWQKSRKT